MSFGSVELFMDRDGYITYSVKGDDEVRFLGHVTGNGIDQIPDRLTPVWRDLERQYFTDVENGRAESDFLESHYRESKGF